MYKFVLVVCFTISAGALCLAAFFFLKIIAALIELLIIGIFALGRLLANFTKWSFQKFRDTQKKN